MPTYSVQASKAGPFYNFSEKTATGGKKAFAQIEANLSAILDNLDACCWNADKDLRYTCLNTKLQEKLTALTGRLLKPGDEVEDLAGLLDPAMSEVWELVCKQAFAGEQRRLIQTFRVQGCSTLFELAAGPVLNEGKVSGITCMIRDLTAVSSEKLKIGDLRFRALVENGNDIIVIIDGAGQIVYSSPSIEHYFGIGDAENLQKNAWDYIYPEDLSRLAELFLDVLSSPGKHIPVQTRALTKQGDLIWVEGTVTNWLSTEGINGIVCNFRDVTDRKHAETQFSESENLSRKLEDQLMEEKIVRQKQVLQATIDAQEREREEIGRELHDNVNQILTTAKLYLDYIKSPAAAEQAVIKRSSDIIATAIEEIRKLSRSMTHSFHGDVGLKLCIEDLVDSIRCLDEDLVIRPELELPDEPQLDDKLKTTIFRIVQEQLNNVLKHAQASTVQIAIRQEAGCLSIRITDDGKGFDPGKKREGIGLTNIINRAEIFSGRVTIDSSPGRGCCLSVFFQLPSLG